MGTAVGFFRRNALGLVAIFIALSGTAIATQVNRTTKVVKPEAETSKKPKGKPGPRGPKGPAGPQGPAGLQGASGLAGTIGRHSATAGGCGDDDQNGDECTTVNLTLPQAGRVLLVATANWRTAAFDDLVGPNSGTDQTNLAAGVCVLTADGPEVPNTEQTVGETQGGTTEPPWSGLGFGSVGTTGVTDSLTAGSHAFTLRCTEIDGDVDWSGVRLSAVSLGSG